MRATDSDAPGAPGAETVIKHVDMDEPTQKFALELAAEAIEKFKIEKEIASHIKKEFDKRFEPTWHCVVGRNFGSYVTHEKNCFIYFYIGNVAILLFKNG
ncbi:dynein light chain 1, putative [Babesia caballi]|uniref:Dynein light chain n=1 Tax=Babesia caballi TaxID=5871 RepID=A0AAV4M474_BABCB|nr:dynein light chain 1, putative [Babesia caballi]